MALSKQQVKALLDVVSKDDTRPALTHATFDWYEGQPVLVATDGYILAALNLGNSDWYGSSFETHKGKLIHRDSLTRWYKLASNKDVLEPAEMLEMAVERDEHMQYPNWQNLLKDSDGKPKQPEATTGIAFQAAYALTLEKLAGHALTYEFHGKLGMVKAKTDGGLYILMPLKS